MSDTQARLFEAIPTAAEQASDDREHELDRTPRGVVRQALARLLGAVNVGLLDHHLVVTARHNERAMQTEVAADVYGPEKAAALLAADREELASLVESRGAR
jgi:hypothetical protein